MSYYIYTPKLEEGLEKLRKRFISLEVDDAEGNSITLNGVLCRTKRGQWCVSEGTVQAPELRFFNVNRIKGFRVDGQTFKPKGE